MAVSRAQVRKRQRLYILGLAMLAVSGAVALTLTAVEDSISLFYSPAQLAGLDQVPGRRLRIGGLVEEGSVAQNPDGSVAFRVTDLTATIAVTYAGILPDLFREGQGVVAEGYMRSGAFAADEVLAKHDENYMPKEVADALKASGQWKEIEAANAGRLN